MGDFWDDELKTTGPGSEWHKRQIGTRLSCAFFLSSSPPTSTHTNLFSVFCSSPSRPFLSPFCSLPPCLRFLPFFSLFLPAVFSLHYPVFSLPLFSLPPFSLSLSPYPYPYPPCALSSYHHCSLFVVISRTLCSLSCFFLPFSSHFFNMQTFQPVPLHLSH